jgi:hypothetical protein
LDKNRSYARRCSGRSLLNKQPPAAPFVQAKGKSRGNRLAGVSIASEICFEDRNEGRFRKVVFKPAIKAGNPKFSPPPALQPGCSVRACR